MGNNLFIAHTPYHITLAMSIIKTENLNDNILIVYDTFNINNEQIEIFDKYFNKIYIINNKCNDDFLNKFSIKEWIEKNIYINYDIQKFESILLELKEKVFNKIFFSNNTYIEIQILINILKTNLTQIYYIEDGCAAYHDIIYKERFFGIKKILKPRYLFFGLRYKFLWKFKTFSAIGMGEEVLGGYYINKNYIRDDLKNMLSQGIDIESYKEVIQEFYPDNGSINDSIIIIMDHSKSKYCDELINILKLISNKEKNIYIKYHPREKNFYADFLLSNNVKKLKSSINIESILVNTYGNIIIGNGGSTTFLTSPLISKNKFVITNSLFNLNINPRLIDIEKKLGAIEINDFNELNEIINNTRRDKNAK